MYEYVAIDLTPVGGNATVNGISNNIQAGNSNSARSFGYQTGAIVLHCRQSPYRPLHWPGVPLTQQAALLP